MQTRTTDDPAGQNGVALKPTDAQPDREAFILPRRIAQAYAEVDGRFYARDTQRVMFEDRGQALVTSAADPSTVADMVDYAHARQWTRLQLTGAPGFRREAWLQAQCRGMKTVGYTPREADLVALKALKALTGQRAPAALASAARPEPAFAAAAPRQPAHRDPAAAHVQAELDAVENLRVLRDRPGLEGRASEELGRLAYWRGITMAENRDRPAPERERVLSRFDALARDPGFLRQLEPQTQAAVEDRSTERVARRQDPEQTL